MRWMEDLEYMEESLEKEEEKSVESNTSSKINSVYDLEDKIIGFINDYKSIKELEELEFYVGNNPNYTELYNIVFDEISKLIVMGKTKFGISDDRIKEIFEQNNFSFDNEFEKGGKSI